MLKKVVFALLTSSLLWLPWLGSGFVPLLFIAFIPLLFLERTLSEKDENPGWQWSLYCLLCFGSWNLISTLWLTHMHWTDLLTTVLLSSFLMTFVMVIFRWVKKILGNQRGYIALPFLWLSFENLSNKWDVNSSWLILGNGFVKNIGWVQWYEFTGVPGGTLWVWIINLVLFGIFIHFVKNKNIKTSLGSLVLAVLILIIVPVSLSQKEYQEHIQKEEPVNVFVEKTGSEVNNERSYTGITDKYTIQVNRKSRTANDLIPRLSYFMAVLIILYSLVRGILKKEKENGPV